MFKKTVHLVTIFSFLVSILAPSCLASVRHRLSVDVEDAEDEVKIRALKVRRAPQNYAHYCQDPKVCNALRYLMPDKEFEKNVHLKRYFTQDEERASGRLSLSSSSSDEEEERESDDEEEESSPSSFFSCCDKGCLNISKLHAFLWRKILDYSIDGLFVFNGVANMVAPVFAYYLVEYFDETFKDETIPLAVVSFFLAGLQGITGLLKKHRDRKRKQEAKFERKKKKEAQATLHDEERIWAGEGYRSDLLSKNPRKVRPKKKKPTSDVPLLADLGSDVALFAAGLINLSAGLFALTGNESFIKAAMAISGALQSTGMFLKKLKDSKDTEKRKRRKKKTETCQRGIDYFVKERGV